MATNELTEARHGRFLYNRNDVYIGKSLAVYGEWSEAEIWLFNQIVKPGDTVLEAGANIGSHTVWLSKAVGDAGSVIAYEPQRTVHQLLSANLALNDCFNVQTRREAIGAEAGTVEFPHFDPTMSNNFGSASLLGSAGCQYESLPLAYIDGLELNRIDFIKADIEGYECELLRGATATLTARRPVVYLELSVKGNAPTGNRNDILALLKPLGYRAYYFFAPMFNADNYRGVQHDIFQATSLDLLCVPDDIATVDGLTEAIHDDTSFTYYDGGVVYSTQPWHMARLRYR